jgi:uncharacterized membrane-anchored protein
VGSLILVLLLLLTLAVWHHRSGTSIRVEYISDAPTEAYYRVAFLIPNTLGTAAGDFLAKPAGEGGPDLGTIGSSLVFAVVPVVAVHRETKPERGRTAGAEPR